MSRSLKIYLTPYLKFVNSLNDIHEYCDMNFKNIDLFQGKRISDEIYIVFPNNLKTDNAIEINLYENFEFDTRLPAAPSCRG